MVIRGMLSGIVVTAMAMVIALAEFGELPFAAHADGGRALPASAAPVCARAQLTLGTRLIPPAMGHEYLMYVLRNRSGSACSLLGTPRLTILHPPGHRAPAIVVHASRIAIHVVRLEPGESASFIVDAHECPFDPTIDPKMPTVTQITLPGQPRPFSFTSPATTQCARQELAVSSIVRGQAEPPGVQGQ